LTYRFHTRWATTGPPEVCNDMLNLWRTGSTQGGLLQVLQRSAMTCSTFKVIVSWY
jgi:hypothetical protein